MMKPILMILVAVLGTPLAAQTTMQAPEGCTPTLTVQSKNCVMSNIWQCEADDPGDQWIALIAQTGLFSVQKVDREFQWVQSFAVTGNERLIVPADDPASLDELFSNQVDTWDFTLETDDGLERHVGFDMLTGETTVIDGVTLLNTEYQGRTLDADGNEVDASVGRQFVSEDLRLFFFGTAWDEATPDDVLDMSPVEFIFPGEPGFFSESPKYECNEIDAGFRP